jgi:hypothetical protein
MNLELKEFVRGKLSELVAKYKLRTQDQVAAALQENCRLWVKQYAAIKMQPKLDELKKRIAKINKETKLLQSLNMAEQNQFQVMCMGKGKRN